MKINKTSKRQTLHQKHKVIKKIKEHQRDVRKQLKNKSKRTSKKHDTIPTELPFREKIIAQMEKTKEAEKLAFQKRMMDLKKFNNTPKVVEQPKTIKDVSRAFASDINKIVSESDVIVEVLDARDPMGTRSKDIEKQVINLNKTLILLLNKIDLITSEDLLQWVEYLGQEALVFPFKATTQKQADKIGVAQNYIYSINTKGSTAFGVDRLINFFRSIKMEGAGATKKQITVGVVGMPNTGKSSVINSLKRKRICEAGNLAGLTRHIQKVTIDSNITLVDSPGIVLSYTDNENEYVLKNCTRLERLEDPQSVAMEVLKRCGSTQFRNLYQLNPKPDNVEDEETEFKYILLEIGQRYCPMKKKGIVNMRAAAMKVLKDWNCGKIYYCSTPPTKINPNANTNISTTALGEVDLTQLRTVSKKLAEKIEKNKQQIDENLFGEVNDEIYADVEMAE